MNESTEPGYLQGNIDNWSNYAKTQKLSIIKRWQMNPCWGIWKFPDHDLGLLPAEMSGIDALEIGCGTGYVSSWMAKRGATVTGIDPTPAQLQIAKEMSRKHELDITFLQGFGEHLPFEDESFDFVISEYGSSLWSDPYLWIPEAARVTRPGGKLVFLTNSPFVILTSPETEEEGFCGNLLRRPYQELHRVNWVDAPGETEFHLPHGKWIELLIRENFRIDALHEISARPNEDGSYSLVKPDWAKDFPAEEVWVCTKTAT